jgi:glycosyltransferase involved in cell wall biosynthesis
MVPSANVDRSTESRIKVSVVIPAYNAASMIQATLESVLRQTVPPHEILVMNDGSTDDTVSVLNSYKPRVTVLHQKNRGVAGARNALCKQALGDLIAFLDQDDIWHPRYLEIQCRLFADYPNAVAFFTGHVNFQGYGTYGWGSEPLDAEPDVELIPALSFLKRYNQTTGPFASMSYCCVPKGVLVEMSSEPFRLSGVDDAHFCTLLPLLARPIVYAPVPLVAYRITSGAQSVNRLKIFTLWVEVFQLLEERYQKQPRGDLLKAFRMAFASKRRSYGKILMGAGRASEARRQFWSSLGNASSPVSRAKSLALLLLSYMPPRLQPRWPPSYRESKGLDNTLAENQATATSGPRAPLLLTPVKLARNRENP